MTTLSTLNSRGRDAPRLPNCSTAHTPKMQQRTACLNRQKPVLFYRLVTVFLSFIIQLPAIYSHHLIHILSFSHITNGFAEGGGNKYFR